MNIKELLLKPELKNYLDKFFNRVNIRKLSKTFNNILVDFDNLFVENDLVNYSFNGNSYPKLNEYLYIMTSQTLKSLFTFNSKKEIVNQIWYANNKSKHGFVAYLNNILALALNRIKNNSDVFNSALVVLTTTLVLEFDNQKFKELYLTTKDLNSDFDEIIFRIQQSMNALVPLEKMYMNWYNKIFPKLLKYLEKISSQNEMTYLNANLNVSKIIDNIDFFTKNNYFLFVYDDQLKLPSNWINYLIVVYCLWNFKNGNNDLKNMGIVNLKYGIVFNLNTNELNGWLKQYFSLEFNDLIKKITKIINANKN